VDSSFFCFAPSIAHALTLRWCGSCVCFDFLCLVPQLFSLAGSGVDAVSSSVLSVVLNLLSEKDVVNMMLVSGEPMRLSALFMKLEVC
jgi:hypothetical protein